MTYSRWINGVSLVLAVLCFSASAVDAQEQSLIPESEIATLQTQLAEAKKASSSARKKLGIRRVIRSCEGLLDQSKDAPNRFEVLSVLFRTQQEQIGVDDSTINRRSLLETSRLLAAAPNDYAALRLDADLLLSQAELAQRGADQQARADALKPLVQRYFDTEVEARVIRIAMLMAIEFGDASLIQHLRETIAQRMPGNLEMINFQRDQLAGQVFGAPFVGKFKGSDGKAYRFPMDGMGKTTALYFWSKEDGGIEQLKNLIEGWKKQPPESDTQGRYHFVSFNLDGLPDAGEGVLREIGLDWPALHLPGGRENPIYKTYVRTDPKLLTTTPTGYTAMVMSGATRPGKGWERSFQSGLARMWAQARYVSRFQSLLAGDFLVTDPTGGFDPAAPPEWKAVTAVDLQAAAKLTRSDKSVPAEQLAAIQACFVKAPMRYRLPSAEVRANYAQAEQLCRKTIAKHPDADDLWIVRNRLIVSLMGRWKAESNREYFDAALTEANAAIEAGYPAGTDIIARFCIARQALRKAEGADLHRTIDAFVYADGNESKAATAHVLGSLLALEIGDRKLHERYRRASLDQHAQTPVLWNATSYLMDRFHRYWLYHPPFTAGWTYGRRQGYFLNLGAPEDADRSVQLELKTLDGDTVRIPDDAEGKWSIVEFQPSAAANPHLHRYGTFAHARPHEDVQLITAVLDDNAALAQEAHAKRQEELIKRRQQPDHFETMLVAGGLDNPIVQQLGVVSEDKTANIAMIRPDGSIAAVLNGRSANAMQNVIEWHDEKAVEDALAKGDLEEAKRLAFAHAPVKQEPPPDAPRHWKPKKIGVTHMRARAKVYMAMGEWEAAKADAQVAYLAINSKAGHLSMRTKDLEDIEQLKAEIEAKLNQKNASTK